MVYEAFGHYLGALPVDLLERGRLRSSALLPVLPAVQHIQDNLARPISNSELAAICSMSEDHFIRRFRGAVGLSPARYILKRRVAFAARQLLSTTLTIEQIAEASGFGDRVYFSRVFARETGRPPAAYRRGPRT
jgi:transcriptional regulator GlxA family with amidase domain